MKEAGVAFQPLGNINDTLLEGLSRTIQVLENQAMKKIRIVICLTILIMVNKFLNAS